jgi:hypothetical protein
MHVKLFLIHVLIEDTVLEALFNIPTACRCDQ